MGDLISRQAAIDAAVKMFEAWYGGSVLRDREIRARFDVLPSAQPERKTGKWINEGRIIRCNKCKIGYATVKGTKSALTYNFCPNCGTDMRGEQDG